MIATGEQHSVREFIEMAAREIDMRIEWRGKGAGQVGYDSRGRCIIKVDPKYFRPTEVDSLLGDAAKASHKLGWKPRVTFRELVAEMMKADLEAAQKDKLVKENGFKVYSHRE